MKCEYCDENNHPYPIMTIGAVDLEINKRRIHTFLELSDRNFRTILMIKYCPFCGRKLNE